jgi:hypothetical protein
VLAPIGCVAQLRPRSEAAPHAARAPQRLVLDVVLAAHLLDQTKELIEQIKRMKGQLAGARERVADGCTPASGGVVPATASAAEPSEFPEGIYRADLPFDYLIGKGMDPISAHEVGGLVTLIFENDRWRTHQQGSPRTAAGRIHKREQDLPPARCPTVQRAVGPSS